MRSLRQSWPFWIGTFKAQSKNLNAGKYQALQEQAQRLGSIRFEVWQRYASINGIGLTDRKIRREACFPSIG